MNENSIILLTHEYPPKRGGAGTYCEELVHACGELNLPIEAWVPEYAKEQGSGKTVPMPVKGSQDWICSFKSIRQTSKRLKGKTGQVILHLAEPGSLRAYVRFGWMVRKTPKLIVTIHGTELIRFCINPLEKFLFRRLLQKAQKIHVLSSFNKKALLKLFPELEDKVLLFPGAPARRLIGRKNRSSSPDEKIKVLCVGRIHPRKGQDCLLEAMANLPKNLSAKVECLFVGPIVNKKFSDKLRKMAGLTNCPVSFLGDLADNDLQIVYESADLFLMPSMPRARSVEGFGFVYLEANSHGLPVIAHRTGGVEDAVLDGKTGFLVNPDEPAELVKRLGQLIEDNELRKEMGEEGVRWASSHSWDEIAMQIYSEV
jgi:glycosyltransferase involved in cell wall biosynthesis